MRVDLSFPLSVAEEQLKGQTGRLGGREVHPKCLNEKS